MLAVVVAALAVVVAALAEEAEESPPDGAGEAKLAEWVNNI